MSSSPASRESGRELGRLGWVVGGLLRLLGFAALWWVLSEGAASTWVYAMVLVPAATATSLWLLPPRRWQGSAVRRGWAALHLFGWFVWQSLRGGIDVALRASRRPVDVDPVEVTIRLTLRSRRAQVLLADISSLTPGSLTVDLVTLDGSSAQPGHTGEVFLHVHVLHHELPVQETVHDLERLIARVWGEV